MDHPRFDQLARAVAQMPRRRLLATALSSAVATVLPATRQAAAACKKVNQNCDKNKDCCSHAHCPSSKCRCKTGFSNCNNACFDLDTDEQRCGSCTNACAAGERCCDGDCVDLDLDPDNCGSCGNQCAETEECVDGSCLEPPGGCPPGADLCVDQVATLCGEDPNCICSNTTDNRTMCGQIRFDAVCGECASSADCQFLGADAFCVKSQLPCCGPDAQNVCRLPCETLRS